MQYNSQKIKEIYNGKVAKHYDLPISHMFKSYKKKTFQQSAMKTGDQILVFCCGTGLDFAPILKRIGKEGKITGIDFSAKMLEIADRRCKKNKWHNVELIEADVTDNNILAERHFDIGVCTLGISIIPDYQSAYSNLLTHVKIGGEIIVGDMRLGKKGYSRFNPFTLLLAKKYGGSYQGHKNSTELADTMQRTLKDVRMKELFLKSYYYCIGIKTG